MREYGIREKIIDTIKKYNLIQENDIIVVAVSGGPDSMCLLDNLICLKQNLKIKEIVVAHLNHMIRTEAQSETEYVEKYCKQKQIKCFCKYVDILKICKEYKKGTEEVGREERYKWFEEVATKTRANKIAIAHNLNDNAETVLIHLLRGSGNAGLSGIKPSRENKYIRPLIKCERKEIEKYCEEQKLNPKFDKTNKDNQYTRNKVRNELIPYIKKEFNPNIIETLDRLSEIIAQQEEYMQKITSKEYTEILEKIENKVQTEKNIQEPFKVTFDLKKFNQLDYIIKSRIIIYTIKTVLKSKNTVEKVHIEDIIKLCSNNVGNKFLIPNKNLKVLVQDKKVYFEKLD